MSNAKPQLPRKSLLDYQESATRYQPSIDKFWNMEINHNDLYASLEHADVRSLFVNNINLANDTRKQQRIFKVTKNEEDDTTRVHIQMDPFSLTVFGSHELNERLETIKEALLSHNNQLHKTAGYKEAIELHEGVVVDSGPETFAVRYRLPSGDPITQEYESSKFSGPGTPQRGDKVSLTIRIRITPKPPEGTSVNPASFPTPEEDDSDWTWGPLVIE